MSNSHRRRPVSIPVADGKDDLPASPDVGPRLARDAPRFRDPDTAATSDDGVHRWLILGIGLAAQAASSLFLYGTPMLVPALRRSEHLSLAAAGAVVAAPTLD